MRPTESSPQKNETLLRFANGSKFALKEKFVQVYEHFFQGNDPSVGKPTFWDELFLLKVNHEFLEALVGSMNEEQLHGIRANLNKVVANCFMMLNDENPIRVGHSLETLITLFSGIFKKRFQNFGTDVVTLLTGMEKAGLLFKEFVESLDRILKSPAQSLRIKGLVLRLLSVVQCATDNINVNTLFEYFMIHNLFDALVKVAIDPESPLLAPDALTVLIIFANFAKYEKQNPYLMQLSLISDRHAVLSFGAIISKIFRQNLKILREEYAEESAGLISQMYNWWYAVPSVDEALDVTPKLRLASSLFAMYELLYSNQDFANMLLVTLTNAEDLKAKGTLPRSPSTTSLGSQEDISGGQEGIASLTFSRFLTLSSHLLSDVKDAKLASLSRIVLISLGCLLDNKETAFSIYDHDHLKAVVEIHQAKLPRLQFDEKPRGLIEIIFDILSSFMIHNLRKTFLFDLYNLCLDIIQKSLSYQRVHKTKSLINYGHLWKALLSLMAFLVQHGHSFPKSDVFAVAEKIVTIFNIAIIHGDDIFVDGPTLYNVYYEILRNHYLFRNLNNSAISVEAGGGSSHSVVSLNLTNIDLVHSHFQLKIESWQLQSGYFSLSPEQVLTLIHQNLDTLELKKIEKLELFERYCEHPQQSAFFRSYLRGMIADCRRLNEHQGPEQQQHKS